MKTTPRILSILLAAAATATAQTGTGPAPTSAGVPASGTGTGATSGRGGSGGGTATGGTSSGRLWDDSGKAAPFLRTVDRLSSLENQLAARNRLGPATFIGIYTSALSADLTAQLQIAPNTGLIVDGLSKDGPAAKCGVQEKDVLTKLDDQILIHPYQFAVLVGNHKEGDNVKVSLLRKGQPLELTATLTTHKPEPGLSASGFGMTSGGVDILMNGRVQEPLRTYTRRLELSGPSAAGSSNVPTLREDVEFSGPFSGSSEGPGETTNGSRPTGPAEMRIIRGDGEATRKLQEQIEDLRKTLEALDKKIDAMK